MRSDLRPRFHAVHARSRQALLQPVGGALQGQLHEDRRHVHRLPQQANQRRTGQQLMIIEGV